MPQSSSTTSQIGQLQLCNEDTPFAVMCVSWLLSMTPQAASTCCRWLTSVAATREISQRRYSGNSSSFVDSTSLLPVASLIAVTTRTRQRTTRPHCKVEVWNFFNFLGHVELFWLYRQSETVARSAWFWHARLVPCKISWQGKWCGFNSATARVGSGMPDEY